MDLSGSPRLVTAAHVVAIVGALLTAVAVWLLAVGFQVAGSEPSRQDYVTEAQGLGILATLVVVLGPLCVAGLGGSGRVLASYVVAAAVIAGFGALAYARRTTVAPDTDNPVAYALQYVFLVPTTWPLLLLALVSGVRRLRGRSSPAPR